VAACRAPGFPERPRSTPRQPHRRPRTPLAVGARGFGTCAGTMETEATVTRGINSIQLMNDGSRWWIVSVFWDAERPDNPLPAEYLRPG
jgi:hypothetical protein